MVSYPILLKNATKIHHKLVYTKAIVLLRFEKISGGYGYGGRGYGGRDYDCRGCGYDDCCGYDRGCGRVRADTASQRC